MKAEEVFRSKTKDSQVTKEWEEAERGRDPLIEFWEKRKREQSVCELEEHKSHS